MASGRGCPEGDGNAPLGLSSWECKARMELAAEAVLVPKLSNGEGRSIGGVLKKRFSLRTDTKAWTAQETAEGGNGPETVAKCWFRL